MFKLKKATLLFLILIFSLKGLANSATNFSDSLNVKQIDSILKVIKKARSSKKIQRTNSLESYHFYNADKSLFSVAVYSSSNGVKTLTQYFFINKELSKVIYKEQNRINVSTYYFSNGRLISKTLNEKIHSPAFESLLTTATILKEEIK